MSNPRFITQNFMINSFNISRDNANYFFDNLYDISNMSHYNPFLLAWTYQIYIATDFLPLLDIPKFNQTYISDNIIINIYASKQPKSIPKNASEKKTYIFKTKTTLIRYYDSIIHADTKFNNLGDQHQYYVNGGENDENDDADDLYDIEEDYEDDEDVEDVEDVEDDEDDEDEATAYMGKNKGKGRA